MIRWVFVVLGTCVVCALFLSIKFGISPKPVPLIKATEVDLMEEAGVLVYRRIRQDIRKNNVVIAGSLPLFQNYQKFWQGFVLGANNDGAKFEKILYQEGLTLFKEAAIVEQEKVTSLQILFSQILGKPQTKRLVYLPSTEATHFNEKSFSSLLNKTKVSKTSIVLHRFWTDKNQGLDCEEESKPRDLLSRLDCLGLYVTRHHHRKKLDPKKMYVAAYRYAASDIIVFLHIPKPSNQ